MKSTGRTARKPRIQVFQVRGLVQGDGRDGRRAKQSLTKGVREGRIMWSIQAAGGNDSRPIRVAANVRVQLTVGRGGNPKYLTNL
jgi:hypothetical protein